MPISPNHIVALIVAISFSAGLNVYATVATLGLLGRFGTLQLPPGLHLLQDWTIIIVAVALFLLELFADKVPYFDLLWNALHTFIRVPVAALLAYGASHQLSPEWQMLSVAAATGVSLAAHAGKTAVRAGVTPSPEPFSNAALSAGEDVFAIALTWFASHHPYIAGAIAIILTVFLIMIVRWLIRRLRDVYRRLVAGPNATGVSQT
jgi:hypothetical protein